MYQEERKLDALFYCFDCDKNVCVKKKRKYSFSAKNSHSKFSFEQFSVGAINSVELLPRNKIKNNCFSLKVYPLNDKCIGQNVRSTKCEY